MLMNVKITACSEPWLLGGFQLDILKRQRPSSFLVLFFITVKFVRVPLVLVSRRLAFIQPKPLPLIRVLLQKFFIISCWVLSSPSTKEESKNHRLICMHFLSRAICRRLLLRCFIGFTEKLTITNWIVAVPTLVEERIPLGLTGNSSSSQQRQTFLICCTPHFCCWNDSFWMKEILHKLGTSSAGTDRKLYKKKIAFLPKRGIDIFHLVYSHTFLLKPFFLNEGNFAQISIAKELRNI